MTTGKRAERTKRDLRCPIWRSAIVQASSLICACRRQVTFPFVAKSAYYITLVKPTAVFHGVLRIFRDSRKRNRHESEFFFFRLTDGYVARSDLLTQQWTTCCLGFQYLYGSLSHKKCVCSKIQREGKKQI